MSLAVNASTLEDARRLPGVYRPITVALVIGATASLAVGLLQPAAWVLALLLGAILTVLWIVVVGLFLRADAWGEERPARGAEVDGATEIG